MLDASQRGSGARFGPVTRLETWTPEFEGVRLVRAW